MSDLRDKYEEKFNAPYALVKPNEYWDRYYKKGEDFFYERLVYSIDFLYGEVLDVGAADGFSTHLIIQKPNVKNVIGLEIQDKSIVKFRENLASFTNVKVVKGIGEEIPFPDNSFDCVHCGATLEHVLDDQKTISEIARVTRDIAVFRVPLGGGISPEHVREYEESGLRAILVPFFRIADDRIFIRDNGVKSIVIVCKKLKNE